MNIAPFLLLLAPQAPVVGTYEFRLLNGDTVLGSATMSVRGLEGGQRQVGLTVQMRQSGQEVTVRQETIYNPDGSQRRMTLETVLNRNNRTTVRAEFDRSGATVTTVSGTKTDTRKVPLDAKAPRENPAIFWFAGKTPAVGEKAVYYFFTMSDQEWNLGETRYVGRRNATIGGGAFSAHELMTSRGRVWVDGQGVPLVMELSATQRLERVMEAPRPGRPR